MNALDNYWILYREPDEEAGVSYLGEFETLDEAISFRRVTTPDEWAEKIEQEVIVSTTRLKAIVKAMDEYTNQQNLGVSHEKLCKQGVLDAIAEKVTGA